LQTGATLRLFLPSSRWGDAPGPGPFFTPAVGAMVLPGRYSRAVPGFLHLKPGSIPGSRGICFGVNQKGKGVSQCSVCVFLSRWCCGPL
jgi:hypothetical protein